MSVRIQNALGILSSDVPVGNLVWVDAVNGVDVLASRGRMTIPFKSLKAAKDAAVVGDTIVVLPGTYNERDLLKNGVNWHFLNGAKVNYSGASDGGIFDTGGSSIASSITGYGEFINNATATNSNVVLVTTATGLNLQIQAKAMSSNKSCVKVNVSGGTVDINVALSIVSVAERTIQNLGSAELVSVRADHIRSSGGAAVYIGAGGMQVTAHRIEASGAGSDAAVAVAGSGTGSSSVRAFEIFSVNNVALRWAATAATKVAIIGARLKSTGSTSNGRAVDIAGTGPNDNVRLHSCVLLASKGGSPGDGCQAWRSPGPRVDRGGASAGEPVHEPRGSASRLRVGDDRLPGR